MVWWSQTIPLFSLSFLKLHILFYRVSMEWWKSFVLISTGCVKKVSFRQKSAHCRWSGPSDTKQWSFFCNPFPAPRLPPDSAAKNSWNGDKPLSVESSRYVLLMPTCTRLLRDAALSSHIHSFSLNAVTFFLFILSEMLLKETFSFPGLYGVNFNDVINRMTRVERVYETSMFHWVGVVFSAFIQSGRKMSFETAT